MYNINKMMNTKEPVISYNCRNCNKNLASNNPASQYQKQKLIQNTVRVASSLYSMNLAGLTVYRRPLTTGQLVEQAGTPYYVPPGVNWNQMSDRPVPSVQKVKTGSGSTYGASSTRSTIVRNRPGAMSPGGIGVDIKHNSYDRYLNRLKGKAPLRRGLVPPTFGLPYIPFTQVYPIYGGKQFKTSIIDDCVCPQTKKLEQNKIIYDRPANAIQEDILSVTYHYTVGDEVWARKDSHIDLLYKATILSIDLGGIYELQFEDGTIIYTTIEESKMRPYYNCNCNPVQSATDIYLQSVNTDKENEAICTLLNLGNTNLVL
jgi:hypothetical protein